MARLYRFFTRHLVTESLPQNPERPFHLTETLEPEIFYQMAKVLRAAPGDKIILLPAAQEEPYFEYEYAVESAQKKDIVLRFLRKKANENELDFNLGLILCVPNKPDKLEFILQKAVELGVNRITLVEGDFSQMRHNLRTDRLEKIIIEAAEQSERAMVPELLAGESSGRKPGTGKLGKYLESLPEAERKNIFVAMERLGEEHPLQSILQNLHPKSARADSGGHRTSDADLQILVGPEGGFSDAEKQFIKDLKLTCFSMGKRILRMETAAILALGLASMPIK